jgi:hypothetical protein
MLNSASPDRPQYESSTIMVPVKNAPTTAPKIVMYAGAWRAEGEQARLRSRLCFDLQHVVRIPRDVKSPRHMHDAAHAVGFARVFRRVVAFRIPRRGDSSAFSVDRYSADVASGRGCHSIAPVFRDLPDPVACQIERGIPAAGSRRPCPRRRALPPQRAGEYHQAACGHHKQWASHLVFPLPPASSLTR